MLVARLGGAPIGLHAIARERPMFPATNRACYHWPAKIDIYTVGTSVTIDTMSQPDLASASASNGDHDGDKEELPLGLVCPTCGSKLIRRAMRRTLKDRFLSKFGRWPYRCQMCDMKFHGPQDPASIAREAAEHARIHEEPLDEEEPENPSDESKK
jgi:predicted RNA-binding Zn-ribbon protein involved in translation (DUF1610 family)